MPVFYALVARGTIVLTEYTGRSGNFVTVTRMLLGKINPATDAKMSYIYDDFVFHYMVEDGVTYLCLSEEKDTRRIPFLFLQDMKERFIAHYGSRAKTAIAFAMPEFSRTIQDRMVRFAVPSLCHYVAVSVAAVAADVAGRRLRLAASWRSGRRRPPLLR